MLITKRTGHRVEFDERKIHSAILSCLTSDAAQELSELKGSEQSTGDLAKSVLETAIAMISELDGNFIPEITVENVQDCVENALIESGLAECYKLYATYRKHHADARGTLRSIPSDVREAFDSSATFFETELARFQFFDKYSRWDERANRRETWPETVDRTIRQLREFAPELSDELFDALHVEILAQRAMPSMRLLAMAGPAAKRNNVAIYNCSFHGVDHPYFFVEALLNSMAGCGVGFSVERKFIDRLPVVGRSDINLFSSGADLGAYHYTADLAKIETPYGHVPRCLIVADSAQGWAKALWFALTELWSGEVPTFDFSNIRPAGSKLKTKGGTASGPEPLRKMLDFIAATMRGAMGRKLTSLEAHDMMCMIGDCVVSGGVRRSAMISLFDHDDDLMLGCKSLESKWWESAPWRRNANNSVALEAESYSRDELSALFMRMDESKAGEPGLFFRRNAIRHASKARRAVWSGLGLNPWEIGVNPCGEINTFAFCNLSQAIRRPAQSLESLARAVAAAAIIGTIQSKATHFPGLRDHWKRISEAERLLGVDITGQCDNSLTDDELELLNASVKRVNEEISGLLGIAPSAAATCNKPSGNSSVMLDCSPGINPRWSAFYKRRVELTAGSPIARVLEYSGVPLEVKINKPETLIATFLVKSPDGCKTADTMSALDQLSVWLQNKTHWTDHNPSCTITYAPDEIEPVIDWLYENQHVAGGLAFAPKDFSGTVYPQAPYEAITEAQYMELSADFPAIDWAMLYAFETDDNTSVAQELACAGGGCVYGD